MYNWHVFHFIEYGIFLLIMTHSTLEINNKLSEFFLWHLLFFNGRNNNFTDICWLCHGGNNFTTEGKNALFQTDFTIMTVIRSNELRNPTNNRSADCNQVNDSGPFGFLALGLGSKRSKFDSRSRCYDFRDCLSPLPSCDMDEISL